MKIDDSSKNALGLNVNTSSAKSVKTAEKASVGAAPTDSVTLSSAGQALAAQKSGGDVFDAKKVEEIKAAIASGQFQVNAERIANGLINSVKDLLSAPKG